MIGEVHRIAPDLGLRQGLAQPVQGLIGQRGKDTLVGQQRVGGHQGRTAGIRDNREPRPLRHPLTGHQFGHVEDVVEFRGAHDTGALEGRFIDGVFGHHRSRLQGRRLRGRAETPRLKGDDGLGLGECPRRRHEVPGSVDGLDVQDDGASAVVHAQIIDEISETDVRGVPEGGKMGQTYAFFHGPVQNGTGEGARLGEQRQVPRLGHVTGKAGVESDSGCYHPEGIRTDDTGFAGFGGQRLDLLIQVGAFGAGVTHPAGDDHHTGHTRLTGLPDVGDYVLRVAAEHSQIRTLGQTGKIRV